MLWNRRKIPFGLRSIANLAEIIFENEAGDFSAGEVAAMRRFKFCVTFFQYGFKEISKKYHSPSVKH
jgi:hypothetical protein